MGASESASSSDLSDSMTQRYKDEKAKEEAQQRELAAKREAAKNAAMSQFGVSGSDVTVNKIGDMAKIGEDWHKVVEK